MKKTLLISGALLALTASVASAGGVNLSWLDCGLAGQQNQAFACNTNLGGVGGTLFLSFSPEPSMPDCVSNTWVIDLQSAAAQLPPWWDMKGSVDPVGRCRDTGFSMNTSFTAGPFSCVDPWVGAIGGQGTTYQAGSNGPNTARIKGTLALPVTSPVAVDAASEYYSSSLIISRAKTVGTPSCAGCLDPVCLVLNEIEVGGIASTQKLTHQRDRNWATWQGGQVGGAGCPLATPTNKSTWGQVKSLYR